MGRPCLTQRAIFFISYEKCWDSRSDTIYIDIDAGIFDESDTAELSNYTMLRTFSHEFTHFVEKWNAVRYNEFRAFVFEKMEQNQAGIVDELIREYTDGGMDYDMASREVVAEGMTDILPESDLVRELAEEHRSIFDKLLEKINEFLGSAAERAGERRADRRAAPRRAEEGRASRA